MIFNEVNQFKDAQHEALMGLWWSGVLLKQQARTFFRDHIVSESQFNVMMALRYAEKPLSQQELSIRLLVDKSNLTGLIDSLEKLDFVKRCKVPDDRRSYQLELTKPGADFLNRVETSYRELVERIMSVFDADELRQITDYMVRLQAGLEHRQ